MSLSTGMQWLYNHPVEASSLIVWIASDTPTTCNLELQQQLAKAGVTQKDVDQLVDEVTNRLNLESPGATWLAAHPLQAELYLRNWSSPDYRHVVCDQVTNQDMLAYALSKTP